MDNVTLAVAKKYTKKSLQGSGALKGEPGKDGVGIADIKKISTSGLIDTYRITMTNSKYFDFNIHNGEQGIPGNKGADGITPSFTIGTVSTLPTDYDPMVYITGTLTNPILNFGIPKAEPGSTADVSDEKVKLTSSSTDAQYLGDLIDNSTIVIDNDNNVLKVVTLDGLEAKITTLNFIKNLDKDIMQYITAIGNPMTFKGVVADDNALNEINIANPGDTYIVQKSASNLDKTMTFVYNGTTFISIAETTIEVRNFLLEPLELSTETTGILPKEKIDSEIARLINVLDKNTYKGSSDGVVKQADLLTGMTCTITALNKAVSNTHTHLNKSMLDKIIGNGIGNKFLCDDGTYKDILVLSSTAPQYNYCIWIDNTDNINPILKIFDGESWIPISTSSSIAIDDSMSDTSESLVQNKVIKNYVDDNLKQYSKSASIAPEFDESTNYDVGDYIMYQGQLHKIIKNKPAGSWDETKVEVTSVSESGFGGNEGTIRNVTQIASIIPNGKKHAYQVPTTTGTKITMEESGWLEVKWYNSTIAVNDLTSGMTMAGRNTATAESSKDSDFMPVTKGDEVIFWFDKPPVSIIVYEVSPIQDEYILDKDAVLFKAETLKVGTYDLDDDINNYDEIIAVATNLNDNAYFTPSIVHIDKNSSNKDASYYLIPSAIYQTGTATRILIELSGNKLVINSFTTNNAIGLIIYGKKYVKLDDVTDNLTVSKKDVLCDYKVTGVTGIIENALTESIEKYDEIRCEVYSVIKTSGEHISRGTVIYDNKYVTFSLYQNNSWTFLITFDLDGRNINFRNATLASNNDWFVKITGINYAEPHPVLGIEAEDELFNGKLELNGVYKFNKSLSNYDSIWFGLFNGSDNNGGALITQKTIPIDLVINRKINLNYIGVQTGTSTSGNRNIYIETLNTETFKVYQYSLNNYSIGSLIIKGIRYSESSNTDHRQASDISPAIEAAPEDEFKTGYKLLASRDNTLTKVDIDNLLEGVMIDREDELFFDSINGKGVLKDALSNSVDSYDKVYCFFGLIDPGQSITDYTLREFVIADGNASIDFEHISVDGWKAKLNFRLTGNDIIINSYNLTLTGGQKVVLKIKGVKYAKPVADQSLIAKDVLLERDSVAIDTPYELSNRIEDYDFVVFEAITTLNDESINMLHDYASETIYDYIYDTERATYICSKIFYSNASNYNAFSIRFGFTNESTLKFYQLHTAAQRTITKVRLTGYKFKSNIYSTEEQKVGTWTDGRAIYGKIIEYDSLPSKANNLILIEGAKKILNFRNNINNGSEYEIQNHYAWPETNIVIQSTHFYEDDKSYILITRTSEAYSYDRGTIYVEYLKD